MVTSIKHVSGLLIVNEVSSQVQKDTSFQELIERSQKKAYWMALDIVGNSEEAEDLCQEAFVKAYEQWSSFRGEAQRDTWFFRILINLCLSNRRRQGVWQRINQWLKSEPTGEVMPMSHTPSDDPIRHLISLEDRGEIEKALEGLSPNQRTAFVLRYLHEFTIKEVAEVMESAPGTVKSHLFRALKAMRQALKHHPLANEARL